ncbi:MAG: hypothetical protein RL662_2377 [Bacteroidota bacterium]|jgi:hypothetical protein
MDTHEHIIESQLVTGQTKCSLFGSKQFVYFYLNYTSKANWLISTDTPHYDTNCKCYQKDLWLLFPNEIAQAKTDILHRIKTKHSMDKVIEMNKLKAAEPIRVQQPLNLMKHKDIKIKPIDWRD